MREHYGDGYEAQPPAMRLSRAIKRLKMDRDRKTVAPLLLFNCEDPVTTHRHQRYSAALDFAGRQVAALVERAPDFFPIYTAGGKWAHAGERWTDWTGGFLTGMMWEFFEHTGQARWRELAERYSRLLEPRQHDRDVHDLGFIFLNSYRPWFELTGDGRLQDVLVQAGRTLAMRFMERGQYLRSFVGPESLFIDIMMNVPLIFYAARVTGDAELERIGVAHCRTTRDRLVRPDGSTAHEGRFNPETGEFLGESTHQGLGAKSAWARGLAWSMYGFSQVYALSGRDEFLAVAECNADYWLAHLPTDHVPYWDFHADLQRPLPWGPQKDSSAGAIAASALLDLELQTGDDDRAVIYRTTAEAVLDALTGPEYLAINTPGWEGILKHGVYHTAKNLGVDESVMWGDFFLVEALTKALGERRRQPVAER
jgi:unsaturated chondroitin disaccharide hydrolase